MSTTERNGAGDVMPIYCFYACFPAASFRGLLSPRTSMRAAQRRRSALLTGTGPVSGQMESKVRPCAGL